MGLISAIVNAVANHGHVEYQEDVDYEDMLPPEHGLDYGEEDLVMFAVPSGKTFLGNVKEVCDRDSTGDIWLYVEYTMVIDETPYTVYTWLIDGHVELIEKAAA